jgi:hypothetical protein
VSLVAGDPASCSRLGGTLRQLATRLRTTGRAAHDAFDHDCFDHDGFARPGAVLRPARRMPMPLPPRFVVKKGTKMWSRCSASMPQPLSVTVSATWPSSRNSAVKSIAAPFTPLTASSAFFTRLIRACSSSSGSALSSSVSGRHSTRSAVPCAEAGAPISVTTLCSSSFTRKVRGRGCGSRDNVR